jgi:hypothetical protein
MRYEALDKQESLVHNDTTSWTTASLHLHLALFYCPCLRFLFLSSSLFFLCVHSCALGSILAGHNPRLSPCVSGAVQKTPWPNLSSAAVRLRLTWHSVTVWLCVMKRFCAFITHFMLQSMRWALTQKFLSLYSCVLHSSPISHPRIDHAYNVW